MRFVSSMTAGVVLALGLAACGGGGGADAEGGGGGGGDGTSGGEYADTIAASADAAIGAQRYEAVCSGCHGPGDGSDGPRVRDLGWTVARLRRQIREGDDEMRPVSTQRLSDEDLEHLLAHLRTMGTVAP